jgi:hypothetical protein
VTRKPVLLHAVVLASYALVAFIFTFPLVHALRTRFPGQGTDVFGFIWNNWWTYHSLTELHVKPYFTDFIFAPFPVDLRLHTFGLLYGLLSIPLMPLLGPVGVLNVQILATIILNGYAAFTLATFVTRSRAAGFISGLLIAATPAIDFHLTVGRPSCAALWPAMFAMWAFLRLVAGPDKSTSAFLAIALTATLLADQQAALFCVSWLTILAGCLLVSRPRDVANLRVFAALGIVAAIVIIPAYVFYWRPFARTDGYTIPGAIEAFRYSYPLRFFWTPSMFWSVYGALMPIALVAALGVALRVPAAIPWLVGSVLFLSLSLGPVVSGTRVWLPFSLLQEVPGFAQFRTPYRFQIPAAIGLAVLAGILVERWFEMVREKRRRLVLLGVVVLAIGDLVAHRVVYGFELRSMPREAVYEEIANDDRNRLVLEVPFGIRTGTDLIGPGEFLNFYQPIHKKRLINGFIARGPLEALAYYRSSPALMYLAHETPPAGDVSADLRRKLAELAVGYVVIHPDLMDAGWLQRTLDLFDGIENLHRLQTRGGAIAFRIE